MISNYDNFSKKLIDHFTYVLATDGDLQEPVALGAAAIAGHLGLNKLVVYYDANDAQISGKVSRSDSVNYAILFDGLGWNVQEIDGHDLDSLIPVLKNAKESNHEGPIMIHIKTEKGKGYSFAEKALDKYHGVSKFNIKTGVQELSLIHI